MKPRPYNRLSAAQVAEAIAARRAGETVRAVAARLGCHFTTVAKATSHALRPSTATSRASALAAKPDRQVVALVDARRPPPKREYRDLPNTGSKEWSTVTSVRAALSQLDKGDLKLASQLVDAMLGDDRISGVWSCRADGLTGLPLSMKPPRGFERDKKALEIAEKAERTWQKMAPEQSIADLLKWGRFLGLGLGQKIYDDNSWVPRIKVWHPEYIRWNTDLRRFQLQVEPSSRAPTGIIDLDHEDPKVRQEWIFYAPYGMDRGWMNGRVRPLAIPWIVRQWTWRDHARHNEVHGVPIRKVKVPTQWDQEEKDRALSEIAQLASESVVRCPVDQEGNGFDLELVEAAASSHEAFMTLGSRADTAIAVVLLGQNLTTEISNHGSRAASQVHERVRQDVIRSDAETLTTCMHEQLLSDWAHYNYDDPDRVPWPCYDVVPPRDQMQAGTALRACADALLVLRQTRLPVDFGKLAEEYGIPLIGGEEIPPWVDPTIRVAEIKADSGETVPKTKSALSARAALPLGALRGQIYASAVGDSAQVKVAPAISPYLVKVLAAIDGAEDYEAVRQHVLDAFKAEAKPDELAQIIEHAVVLAELNGRLSIREDDPLEEKAA